MFHGVFLTAVAGCTGRFGRHTLCWVTCSCSSALVTSRNGRTQGRDRRRPRAEAVATACQPMPLSPRNVFLSTVAGKCRQTVGRGMLDTAPRRTRSILAPLAFGHSRMFPLVDVEPPRPLQSPRAAIVAATTGTVRARSFGTRQVLGFGPHSVGSRRRRRRRDARPIHRHPQFDMKSYVFSAFQLWNADDVKSGQEITLQNRWLGVLFVALFVRFFEFRH